MCSQSGAAQLQLGDVAPLGHPDGVIDAADVLLVKRAALGLVTLGSVNVLPSPPVLNALPLTSGVSIVALTGSAIPGGTVEIFKNTVSLGTIVSDTITGVFEFTVVLSSGDNLFYATVADNEGVSAQSNSVSIAYLPPDADGDGYNATIDCNDSDASVYPGATEICNDAIDNDCNSYVDMEDPACFSVDLDADGYGADVDCNDSDPTINPGAIEICNDGIDNNCNALVDTADPACPVGP